MRTGALSDEAVRKACPEFFPVPMKQCHMLQRNNETNESMLQFRPSKYTQGPICPQNFYAMSNAMARHMDSTNTANLMSRLHGNFSREIHNDGRPKASGASAGGSGGGVKRDDDDDNDGGGDNDNDDDDDDGYDTPSYVPFMPPSKPSGDDGEGEEGEEGEDEPPPAPPDQPPMPVAHGHEVDPPMGEPVPVADGHEVLPPMGLPVPVVEPDSVVPTPAPPPMGEPVPEPQPSNSDQVARLQREIERLQDELHAERTETNIFERDRRRAEIDADTARERQYAAEGQVERLESELATAESAREREAQLNREMAEYLNNPERYPGGFGYTSTGAALGHGLQYAIEQAASAAAAAAAAAASAAGSAITSGAGSSTDPIDVDPDNRRSSRRTQNRRPGKYSDPNFETNFRPGRRRDDDDDDLRT